MKGMCISFEGICGAGKTTQAARLKSYLQSVGVSPALSSDLQDYQDTDIGGRIRSLLQSQGDPFFRLGYPVVEALLLAAMKAYDTQRVIKPMLDGGTWVIEDRSIDTFTTYQLAGFKGLVDASEAEIFDYLYRLRSFWGRVPDLTLFLDVSLTTGVARAEARSGRPYDSGELRMIEDQLSYYRKYTLPQFSDRRVEVISAGDRSEEDVATEVRHLIERRLRSQ